MPYTPPGPGQMQPNQYGGPVPPGQPNQFNAAPGQMPPNQYGGPPMQYRGPPGPPN